MMHTMSQTNRQWVWYTDSFYGYQKDLGVFAMASVVNQMASRGVEECVIDAKITLPFSMQKSAIISMKKEMERAAKKLPIESLHVEGTVGCEAALPFITVTAAGEADEALLADATLTARAGWDIVLTKWVGLEGMLRIAAEKEAVLAARFTPVFLNQIKSYTPQIFALREIAVAKAMGVSVIRQIGEGGILASLHYLAQETGMGLSVDMKKISIKQETIEVCEHFRLNPYQLTSHGSMLMLTNRGEELADALVQDGIMASVIGRLNNGNDKVIHNGEDMRYVDRPAPDELTKIFLEDAGSRQ